MLTEVDPVKTSNHHNLLQYLHSVLQTIPVANICITLKLMSTIFFLEILLVCIKICKVVEMLGINCHNELWKVMCEIQL